MPETFDFFSDSALTVPVNSGAPIARRIATGGSVPVADAVIWLGSPAAGKILRAQSNPGVDVIVIHVLDALGGSVSPSNVKLALTAMGLDSAIGGAALDLGAAELLSGVGNAVAIFVRIANITSPGTFDHLSIAPCALYEDYAP